MRILKIFPSNAAIQVFVEQEDFEKYYFSHGRMKKGVDDIWLRAPSSLEDCHKLAGIHFGRIEGLDLLSKEQADYLSALERSLAA